MMQIFPVSILFHASMTLVIVWALSIVTSFVVEQEGICDLKEDRWPADYKVDSYVNNVVQIKVDITSCAKQAGPGKSYEEVKACDDISFPSFDEYLSLLKVTLKSKSECELTGKSDACQAVDAHGKPKHDKDKCCRTYYGVVPHSSAKRIKRNATGSLCHIIQMFSIGECRDPSPNLCKDCETEKSLQFLQAYCLNDTGDCVGFVDRYFGCLRTRGNLQIT
ncbi:uncharacterized protein LOC128224086 [Mya arenaria]|uniref:uncharacterized protein LOC128224086 n=1 Tax=Mya arenaria TaxID=6604 RepID=UPI0022E77E72|nr:uncharacterized protein LOC128224086 [Mya arenaria]